MAIDQHSGKVNHTYTHKMYLLNRHISLSSFIYHNLYFWASDNSVTTTKCLNMVFSIIYFLIP